MSSMSDADVRRVVYDLAMQLGVPPLARDVAAALAVHVDEVRASFRRLATAHTLVLGSDGDEIVMAMPYSAVPTPFVVDAAGRRAYANCMWDALGIPAMLHADATISTSCADCGTAATITVAGDRVESEGLVHFALPVRRWWDNVIFT
jgi:hypothetical protein